LVSIFSCEKTNTFLFDGGVSENGVIHNADLLGIRIDQISGIILSHGHFDHFTGLPNVLKRTSSERSSTVDIFLHPDAFLRRWEIYPDGKRARLPFLDEKLLKELGATIGKNSEAKLFPTEILERYHEILALKEDSHFSMQKSLTMVLMMRRI